MQLSVIMEFFQNLIILLGQLAELPLIHTISLSSSIRQILVKLQ